MKAAIASLQLKEHNSRFSSRTVKPTPEDERKNGNPYVVAVEADYDWRVVRVHRRRCAETEHEPMLPLVFPFESCEGWEEDDRDQVERHIIEGARFIREQAKKAVAANKEIVEGLAAADSAPPEKLAFPDAWRCGACGRPCASAAGLAAHKRAHAGAT